MSNIWISACRCHSTTTVHIILVVQHSSINKKTFLTAYEYLFKWPALG